MSIQVVAGTASIDPELNKDENNFLDEQAMALLELADNMLSEHPPAIVEESIECRLSLYVIDAVLHDVYAAKRVPVRNYFHNRLAAAVREIEATQVTQGALIWKLYNHAFIIRTSSVTIAFDLTRANFSSARV